MPDETPTVTKAQKQPAYLTQGRQVLRTPEKSLDTRPHAGPFYVGTAGAASAGLLLLALALGMKMTLITVLIIIIPGMILATVLLAIAMGWIFIMHGRTRQTPRWQGGTAAMIAVTMAELFTLTYLASLTQTMR